jgi:hypothetical protein
MKDFDVIRVAQHLHFITLRPGYPIEIAVKGYVSVLVNASLKFEIRRRDDLGQPGEIGLLEFEGLGRDQSAFDDRSIHPSARAPVKDLAVQIL